MHQTKYPAGEIIRLREPAATGSKFKNPDYFSLAIALLLITIPVISAGQVTAYPFPEGALKSYRYEVTVNGVNTPVYMGHGAHFTQFSFTGDTASVLVNVIHGSFVWGVEIRPLKNRVANQKIGVSTISFDICDSITQLSLEFNGHKIEPLFIFANPPESGYDQLISGAFVYSTFRFWDMYFDGTDTWHSVSHAKRASTTVIDAQLTNGCMLSPHKDMDIAIGWKAPFEGEFKFEWFFSKMEPVSDSLSIRIIRNSYDDVLSGPYFPGRDKQQSKHRDLILKVKKDDFIFCIISCPSPDPQKDKIKVGITVKQKCKY